jgi:hypothetical protein
MMQRYDGGGESAGPGITGVSDITDIPAVSIFQDAVRGNSLAIVRDT